MYGGLILDSTRGEHRGRGGLIGIRQEIAFVCMTP